ncbi:LuxR C-terminal-related transcriptional regulator [Pseudonocardia ailaonensis]|uniref:LuxR C-terminal-related transcriptional regulator n=1 Tax=Pseudonocardia ailaonensis TaxID=367279 RepID=A0ABN2NPY7_9PSEU
MERVALVSGVVRTLTPRGVVAAKLARPRLSPVHLHRPRLLGLIGADDAPVTLVSAPAGYGKTSFVAEYAAEHPADVGWLSLDGNDDESRLWAGVLAALCTCAAIGADNPLRGLVVPDSPTADPAFLGAVDTALRELPIRLTLVLDDLQELGPGSRTALDHLARRLPETIRLILLTRTDPSLSLQRLRLEGRLREIRSADLAMDVAEATELLAKAGQDLPREQIEVLVEQTDGWPAGVRLAAQSLAATTDPDAYLADLAGNDRAIADYLFNEILSQLPERTVDVLHAVCICDQLPSPLAVALTETDDAAEILDSLERGSGLVTAYGPGRAQYRVHPLLRSYLQASLRRTRPRSIAEIHRRAAGWFLAHDRPAEAMSHLTIAEDSEGLIVLLRRCGVDLVETGYGKAVLGAIAALQADALRTDPLLLAVQSYAHLDRGELGAAQACLERAAATRTEDSDDHGALAVARARLGVVQGRLFYPEGTAEPRLENLRGSWSDRLLEAQTAIASRQADHAEQLARSVLDEPGIDEFARARAMSVLAAATGLSGGFGEMADLARQAAGLGRATGRWDGTESSALTAMLTGYADLMRCRPEDTLAGLAGADPYVARMGPAVVIGPFVDALRAAARFDLGEREAAHELMRRARRATVVDHARDEQIALVAMLAHDIAVQLGHRDEARAVISWAADRLAGTVELAVMRAASPAAISRFDAARGHLAPVLDGTSPSQLSWASVVGWLLECEIALGVGETNRARRALVSALREARDVDVLRPLVSAPAAVSALMRSRLGAMGEFDDFAATVLAVRGRHGLADPPTFTEREQSVLALLPSLRPIADIAVELGVSSNTVKTHVKALYTKLGASSRREAVDTAARLGLLRNA